MIKTLLFNMVSRIAKLSVMMLLVLMVHTESKTQSVDYAIKWHHAYDLGDTLTVYMKSSTTINFPFNQVSTAQVTLRVPTGMLPVFDGSGTETTVTSATLLAEGNGSWSNNARFNFGDATSNPTRYPGGTLTAHEDGNQYDYISFGLTDLGTRQIEFEAGEELALFSFVYANPQACTDGIPIQILDHVVDSSFLENGVTSPNNNMSVLGPGGDIYSGNYLEEYGARCYDYDNDDVPNDLDLCDYTLIDDITGVNTDGCTDIDGDGFFPDDNPTPDDEDASTTTSTDPETVTETYNNFDPDTDNPCVPQGDSLRASVALFDMGVEFTGSSTTICAGEPIDLVITMIETESPTEANTPASPFDYDHRGTYTVTMNGSISGDFTIPMYTSGETVTITPVEDGDIYTIVQVQDTFLCSAIHLDSMGQVNINEGVTLATIDGDATLCGTEDTVNIEIDLVGGTSSFTVTYGAVGADTTTITMFDRDTIISIPVTNSRTYELISVVDAGGCSTPANAMIGSAIIDFTNSVPLDRPDVTAVDPSDCGLTDGSITIDSIGYGPNVEYSINGGVTWQTNPAFTGLDAGNYVVAARKDGNDDCVATVDSIYALASSAAPVFSSVDETQPTDCADNTGSIDVLILSPTGTVEYRRGAAGAWVTGSESNGHHIFQNVPPGTHAIYIRYNDGTPKCEVLYPGGTQIDGITYPTLGTPVANNSNDCTEENGDISLLASSSTGFPLEYQLDTVAGGASIWGSQNVFTNLPAGDYIINVRNAGTTGCIQSTASIEITRPDSLTLSETFKVDITACGDENGTLRIASAGDQGGDNIEYSIDGGDTWSSDSIFTDLGPGVYNAAIRNSTDASCYTPSPIADTITAPEDILLINPTTTDVTDCGESDGTIFAQVASYDEEYTLQYELISESGTDNRAAQASPNFSGLDGDSYDVVISYASGVTCTDTITTSITAPNEITANALVTPSADCGASDGEIQVIDLDAEDGAVEYQLGDEAWQPSNIFSNLDTLDMVYVKFRYADQTCLDSIGAYSMLPPEPTEIAVASVTGVSASECGIDDAKILIDTLAVGFEGNSFEFSIDGTNFQPQDSFVDLSGGIYLVTVRNSNTPSCFDTTTVAITDNTAPVLSAKVYLQGAFNTSTGIMNDDLREKKVLPTSSPYMPGILSNIGADDTASGSNGVMSHSAHVDVVNDPEAASHTSAMVDTMTTDIFDDKAANSVVDWILVELRPFHDSTIIKSRRIGLVQRDGDIVTWVDGESPLLFANTCATADTTYYVSIKHRNHSGTMTLDPVAFNEGPVNIDFTSTDLQLYRLPGLPIPQEPTAVLPNGKRALWGGNVAFNRRVLFQGSINDPAFINDVVLGHPGNSAEQLRNFIANGYYNSDVNMDGVTIYQGAPNDVDIIFFNIMGNPANTNFRPNFNLREQLPENN